MRINANNQHAGEYDLRRLSRQELANLRDALEVFKGPPHWSNSPWTRGMQAQLQAAINAHDDFYYRDLSAEADGRAAGDPSAIPAVQQESAPWLQTKRRGRIMNLFAAVRQAVRRRTSAAAR